MGHRPSKFHPKYNKGMAGRYLYSLPGLAYNGRPATVAQPVEQRTRNA